MNSEEIVNFLRKRYPGRYSDDILKELERAISDRPDTNMLRCRVNGIEAYVTEDYDRTVENNSIYIDKQGRQHFISPSDFLIIGD